MQAANSHDNWHEERQSAWLYRIIAAGEPDPKIADMFRALATAADDQAKLWVAGIAEPPPFVPGTRARLVAWLIRRLGPRAIKPVLATMKVRGLSVLHSGSLSPGHAMPSQLSEVGARHRVVAGGGNLRAAVFGINDGLVSNTCLIMAVAGAGSAPPAVMLAGTAGLLAGALSMASGEYLSMRSQREVFESQIALERAELENYPEEEMEELALIYNARGLDLDAARSFARELFQNPEHALATMAREELGLNPEELGSPWRAAIASFTAFAIGAALPLVPLLWGASSHAIAASSAVALVGLFLVGAALSLFTGRSAWQSGARMVVIGGGAGFVSYLLGLWFDRIAIGM
ncbi:MAG: hypothetical protein EXR86_01960 [Gammaproteobacteria bacterium]|nr:hypothetical protein [Gammaproteobacteria bacterium]